MIPVPADVCPCATGGVQCSMCSVYCLCVHVMELLPPHVPHLWLLDECLCATPGLLRGQAESCSSSITRGCNESNVNSAFPEGGGGGRVMGFERNICFLSLRRLRRTTRAKRGSSPRKLASTSSTAWMTWRRYAGPVALRTTLHFTRRMFYLLLLFLRPYPPV